MKKTLVIGASENPERYSNKAIHMLRAHQHDVAAIGLRKGVVVDVPFDQEMKQIDDVHTITLYVNPKNQEAYMDYILSIHPQRVIFNPGTENSAFEAVLEQNGIQVMEACTLVLLATGQY